MLSACATSQDIKPKIAPDPVVEVRTVVETQCVAELRLGIPPAIPVPAGAIIKANESALNWLGEVAARSMIIEQRLIDAAKECPNE